MRELRNVIQRAIAMGSSDLIEPQDLPGVFEFPEEMTMDKAIKDLKSICDQSGPGREWKPQESSRDSEYPSKVAAENPKKPRITRI